MSDDATRLVHPSELEMALMHGSALPTRRAGTLKLAGLSLVLLAHALSPARAADANDTVRRLYSDFAWEAVMDDPRTPFVDQPRAVLLRYLTPELTDALQRDRRCVQRRREICALDFSPLWGSQDPSASGLKVRAGLTQEQVLVSFTDPASGESRRLKLQLRQLDVGWRIVDVEYPNGRSLRQLLDPRH